MAALLGEEPTDIGDDDNLMDLGLDSMRVLGLVMRWGETGIALEFPVHPIQETGKRPTAGLDRNLRQPCDTVRPHARKAVGLKLLENGKLIRLHLAGQLPPLLHLIGDA